MSFLKSIKGTFSSVQKDIAKGFKSLKTSDGKKKTVSAVHSFDLSVNPDAGADLLHVYEESWAEIHSEIEGSANIAQKVDIDISEICVFYERQNDALNSFSSELSILPQLTKDINNIVSQLETLEQDFTSIENLLLTLEDVCEQQELKANKKKHENQLEIYRQQKNIELEQAKVELANQHAQKVQVYEAKLQESLREKQKAIEETYHYEEEIKNYKLSGETKLKPQSSITSSEADLADICVEDDSSALEEFLEQGGGAEGESSNAQGSDKKEEPKDINENEENDEEDFKDTEDTFVKVTADEDIKEEDLNSQSDIKNVTEQSKVTANADSSD